MLIEQKLETFDLYWNYPEHSYPERTFHLNTIACSKVDMQARKVSNFTVMKEYQTAEEVETWY